MKTPVKTKRPVGRPPTFETAEEMQVLIDEYFDKHEIYNSADLAFCLGFSDRQSLREYRKKPEFTCSLDLAMLRIEGYQNRCLQNGNVAGAKFTLINNFGWKEKIETANTNVNLSTLKPVDQMTNQELKEEKILIKRMMDGNYDET